MSQRKGKAIRSDSEQRTSIETPPPDLEAKGYNWLALSLLGLFVMIPVITGIISVYDHFHPEAADTRRIYENVYKCYNAVGDVEKINKIDDIIAKYQSKGGERALYNNLRKKYGMEYLECDSFKTKPFVGKKK